MKNWIRKLLRKNISLQPADLSAEATLGTAFIIHKPARVREHRAAGRKSDHENIYRNYPCRDCSHEPHCRVNEVACIAWRRWTLDGRKRDMPRGIRFLPLAECD